jgi:hypothetical protein
VEAGEIDNKMSIDTRLLDQKIGVISLGYLTGGLVAQEIDLTVNTRNHGSVTHRESNEASTPIIQKT